MGRLAVDGAGGLQIMLDAATLHTGLGDVELLPTTTVLPAYPGSTPAQ